MTDLAAIKAELRTLLAAATPGPWTLCPDLGGCECGHGTQSIDARAGEVVIAEFRDLTDPLNESESNNTEPVETRRANAALIVALRNHADALLADTPSVEPRETDFDLLLRRAYANGHRDGLECSGPLAASECDHVGSARLRRIDSEASDSPEKP